jgi:dihydrofolate synthase / folylpolyglutamate synthase
VLRRLYSKNLFLRVKMGLRNVERLCAELGHPERAFGAIHVTGTSGKGSTTTKIAAGLRALGYRTGQYVSPHVSSFRERIQVDESLITEAETVAVLERVMAAADRAEIPATFFELTTVAGFLHFAERGVEVAAVEVGLGGRLDATNVLPSPGVCVVTSIGEDHVQILGPTLDDIAREKGGILKPGAPAVLGRTSRRVPLLQRAAELHCPVFLAGDGFADFDAENSDMARAALEAWVTREAPERAGDLRRAIQAAARFRPPCRLEGFSVGGGGGGGGGGGVGGGGVRVVLDTAHNPDALAALLQTLRASSVSVDRVVVALSSDRDPLAMAQQFFTALPHLTPADFFIGESDSTRAMPADVLAAAIQAAFLQSPHPALPPHQFRRSERSEPHRLAEDAAGGGPRRTNADRSEQDASEVVDGKQHLLRDGIGTRYASSSSSSESAIGAALRAAIGHPFVVSGRWDPLKHGPDDKHRSRVVLVTGSVYMMREAKDALGVPQPASDDVVK